MIITHNETEDNLEGYVQKEFTMKADGKAFGIIVDNIYTNKIQAGIRETMSNAYDAHVARGNPEVPFFVHVPTEDEPYFEVRDKGISMTVEKVLGTYTVMFDSDKDETNDMVGAFGIGSMAFYAYTDQASITTIIDGVKNVFTASRKSNGVPSLAFVITEATEEEQGVSVKYFVQPKHLQEFWDEIKVVSRGFPVKPELNEGFELPEWPSLYSGPGWTVHDGPNAIRQGCVIYPVSHDQLPIMGTLSHTKGVLLDVPIGTVSVAANRESLALDEDTKKLVTQLLTDAHQAAKKQFLEEIAAAPTRLEALAVQHKHQHLFGSISPKWDGETLSSTIHVNEDLPEGMEKLKFTTAVKGHVHNGAFTYSTLSNTRIVVDDGTKVKRRITRLKAYNAYHNAVVLTTPTSDQLNRVTAILGLKQGEGIVALDSIPDVTPNYSGGGGGGTKTGVYDTDLNKIEPDDIDDDYYWLPISKAYKSALTPNLCSAAMRSDNMHRIFFPLQKMLNLIKPADGRPVTTDHYLLTPYGESKLKPDISRRADHALKELFEQHKKLLFEQLHLEGLMYGQSTSSYGKTNRDLMWIAAKKGGTECPTPLPNWWNSQTYVRCLYPDGAEKAYNQGFTDRGLLQKKYPLVFGSVTSENAKEYMAFIDNKNNLPIKVLNLVQPPHEEAS